MQTATGQPTTDVLVHKSPRRQRRFPIDLLLVLLGFLALSTMLNVANPIWEAIDEPGHFQYVKFVAEHHRLPKDDSEVPPLPVGGDVNCEDVRCVARGSLVNEPHLYYVLEAPFVAAIDLNSNVSWVANPYFTWWGHPLRNGAALHTLSEAWPYQGMVLGVHIMRLVSALMVAGALAAIYFTTAAISGDRTTALLAAGVTAVTPGLLLTSASVNNDNAAILTGSLALMAAVKTLTSTSRRWLWFGVYFVMLFLAIEAKTTTYFLLPLSLLLLVLLWRQSGTRMWPVVVVGAVAAAVITFLALRTTRFAMNRLGDIGTVLGGPWYCGCVMLPGQHYWGAIPNLWHTYWASYGWETFHPPDPFYIPLRVLTWLAVAGVVYAIWRKLRDGTLGRWLASSSGASLILLAAGFLILFAMVDYRVVATRSDGGTTHARFLFPAITASSLGLVLGLNRFPKPVRLASFGLLFCTCLAMIGYSIYVLPTSYGPTLPVYGDATRAGAQHVDNVSFSNGMRLVGWTLPDGSVAHPGQLLHLRLLWAADRPIGFDYSAFVRLNDGRGSIVHDADHGPGADLNLLSHLWQPGEVIPDDWSVHIPASVPSGEYAVEAGVYDYRDLKPIVAGEHESVTLATLRIAADSG